MSTSSSTPVSCIARQTNAGSSISYQTPPTSISMLDASSFLRARRPWMCEIKACPSNQVRAVLNDVAKLAVSKACWLAARDLAKPRERRFEVGGQRCFERELAAVDGVMEGE